MSFATRLRSLASDAAIYGISSVVGRLITFILFPFYSQYFAPDEYGVVAIVFATFIFANVLYQYGMESAFLKFASDETTETGRRRVASTAVWSLLATSILFSAAVVGFQGAVGEFLTLSPQHVHLLGYVALILVLDTAAVVPLASLRLQNKPTRFAAIRIAGIIVNVALNVYLIAFRNGGIEAVFIANAVGSAVTLLLLLPDMTREVRLYFDLSTLKSLLRFGLPFVPAGLGYAFADRISVFFLNVMEPERVVALYGAYIDPATLATLLSSAEFGSYVAGVFNGVVKLAVIMALVVQMFRYAWQPFFLHHARDADARQLFARVLTLFVAGSLLVVLGVSFFARELVALPLPGGRHLVEPRYWLGLHIVPIALLGYLFQGLYYNFSVGAYVERKTGYFVYCAVAGALVAIAVNALFVPQHGMTAAAWSAVAAYLTMALMLLYFMHRIYPVPYEWPRILGLGAWAGVLFFTWYRFGLDARPAVELALLACFVLGIFVLRIADRRSLRLLFRRSL